MSNFIEKVIDLGNGFGEMVVEFISHILDLRDLEKEMADEWITEFRRLMNEVK